MMKFISPLLSDPLSGVEGLKGKRAYLYCRVAHDDGLSLELQKEELLDYAEQAGLIISGIAAEYAGGLKLDRSALKEVSQAVRTRKADIMLVKSVSRILRDIRQLHRYISFLSKHGAALCSIQQQQLFRGEAL